jgi:NAD(P)H-hydrate epimerase
MNPEIISALKKIFPRKSDTYKGDYGKILVLAGSRGMTGAAYLCSLSALRAGAGLVYLGVAQDLVPVMEIKLTEVIIIPLPQTKDVTLSIEAFAKIKEIVNRVEYLVIGPGLSRNSSTTRLIRKIIKEIDRPVLLDADGVNALSEGVELLKNRKNDSFILTPHPGEFSRLLKLPISEIREQKEELAKKFVSKFKLTLVLKGHHTIVASPDGRFYINTSGNPGMATAGSGDVLAGVIAGLRVQGLDDFQAAMLGVYIHGLAGDISARDKTEISLTSGDILNSISLAFRQLVSNI